MTEAAPLHAAAELTRFIEAHYHASHRDRLPELAALAGKVERVHAGKTGVPHGLADLLSRMIGEMEVHMKKEELILFPAIRKGGKPGIETPIAAMRADHDDHGQDIAQIRAFTGGLEPPDGACRT
jgi:regulator of cell morphogenesis and NO signaling